MEHSFNLFAVSQMFSSLDLKPLTVTSFKFDINTGYHLTYQMLDEQESKDLAVYDFADANLQDLLDDRIIECYATLDSLIFVTSNLDIMYDAWDDVQQSQDDFEIPYTLTQVNKNTFVLSY